MSALSVNIPELLKIATPPPEVEEVAEASKRSQQDVVVDHCNLSGLEPLLIFERMPACRGGLRHDRTGSSKLGSAASEDSVNRRL